MPAGAACAVWQADLVHDAGTGDALARLDRRTAWLVLAAALAALAGLAWWLVPWDWVPGGSLRPAAPRDVLTAAEVERAEDYSSTVRVLGQVSYAVSLAVALVLGLTTRGARLVHRLPGRWWVRTALATAVVLGLQRLVTLPLGLAVRDRNLAEGLTRQALGPWLVDRLLALLVAWVVTTLLVLLVVGPARRWPRRWYLAAGTGAVVLTFAVSLLHPLLVEPLFNRFTPMPQGPLRTSILRLADETGVAVEDVLVADASRRTTTLNAYVSGFAGTRRIVVYDTLLAELDGDEVRSVVVHELGHARHQDVLLGTGLGALGVLGGTALLALLLDAAPLRRRAGVGCPAAAPAQSCPQPPPGRPTPCRAARPGGARGRARGRPRTGPRRCPPRPAGCRRRRSGGCRRSRRRRRSAWWCAARRRRRARPRPRPPSPRPAGGSSSATARRPAG